MSRVDRYEYNNWKEFGARVKKYKNQIGLTTEKFAEMINRTENYVNELEKGNKGCSVHTLHQISKALKVPVDNLLYGEVPSEDEQFDSKEIMKEIINRCNNEELQVVRDVIVALYPHLEKVITNKNMQGQKDK